MSLGLAGISVSPHTIPPPPPGPPFVATSADNGLSVDPGTGRIVLGNDRTFAAGTAQLLSNREIWTNGFLFALTGDTGPNVNFFTNIIQETGFQIQGVVNPNGIFAIANDAGASIQINSVLPATPPELFLSDGGGNATHIINNAGLFQLNDGANNFFQARASIGAYVNIPVPSGNSKFGVAALPAFANNAAALVGGLIVGEFYRISAAGTSAVAVVQ